MILRRCHDFDLRFGIWFLLISEIAQKKKTFEKRLKNENQIDAGVDSANYTFLIECFLIKNSAT